MYKESVYPPPAEYLYINLSQNVLNIDSNGEHVVLARFPSEGKTLEAFGLNPGKLKSIAIPNDLKEWSITALNNCANLETIMVYGEEVDEGIINITYEHALYHLSNLHSIHFPSTVRCIYGGDDYNKSSFPHSLERISFHCHFLCADSSAFFGCALTSVDWSCCQSVGTIGANSFRSTTIRSLDLSPCSKLTTIGHASFYGDKQLTSVILPPSVRTIRNLAFESTVKMLIWKGRTQRPPQSEMAPGLQPGICSQLDACIADGTLTEIFIP